MLRAILHAANPFEQAGINQRSNGLPVLVDDHAVVLVLDAVQHFPKVLTKR